MRILRAAVLCAAMILFGQAALAQSEVKVLTPSECAQVTKRSESEFYINGPIKIGNVRLGDSVVRPNSMGLGSGGIDAFTVISRSCFTGK